MDNEYTRIPIIKLWRMLLVPLQGELTDDLADQLTSEVLERIYREGSSGMVIDITGLWMVDSHLCSVLTQLSASAQLLGAKTIISGLKPEIALTLETMGVQLGSIETALDLEAALASLGLRNPEEDEDEDGDEAPVVGPQGATVNPARDAAGALRPRDDGA
jgi:rsbT antagonist protein RsbS